MRAFSPPLTPVNDPIPSDTESLRAALAAEQQARRQAEARASGAEAMVAHLKLLIAKMKRDRFGASAERGRKLLDQLEMQLEELGIRHLWSQVQCWPIPERWLRAICMLPCRIVARYQSLVTNSVPWRFQISSRSAGVMFLPPAPGSVSRVILIIIWRKILRINWRGPTPEIAPRRAPSCRPLSAPPPPALSNLCR
jgi:transposase IS166 family protein